MYIPQYYSSFWLNTADHNICMVIKRYYHFKNKKTRSLKAMSVYSVKLKFESKFGLSRLNFEIEPNPPVRAAEIF